MGYSQNAKPAVVDQCNGWTIKNGGNCILVINTEFLNPGESKGFLCWPGELYVGRIDISFRNLPTQPMPVVRQAWLTQKFYVDKM